MDKEELAQEQEAKKAAKEQVNKELKKQTKKMIKFVIKAIGAKVIAVAGIVIIASSSLLILVACMNYVLDDDDEDTENVITDNTSEQQIIAFITNYETDNETLRSEMLKDKNIEKIMKWQEETGYTAELLVAMAFEEADGNKEFDFNAFLEEIKQKSAKWKENGYQTVDEIAKDYVGDETTEEWSNNIKDKIKKENLKYQEETIEE